MAFIDVIQHPSERSDEIVFRVPQQGAGEFKFGSQLIVREGQAAVFFATARRWTRLVPAGIPWARTIFRC